MKLRKITSLTAMISFAVMLLTSVILYVVPQGRVAYWADWRLWGLSKTDWGNIHITVGFLFLVTLGLHLYYNWKPMVSYLKNKAKATRVFTTDFNAALLITLAFVVGTYLLVPPFSLIISLNTYLKDSGAETYGEPPYGHAELSSLKTFAQKMNLDLEKSMALLAEAGYPVEDSETTLESIARRYGVPPQVLYEAIKSAKKETAGQASNGKALPASAPPGTGNLTLADFCTQFDLNMKLVVRELKKQGVAATEAQTLKQIAAGNNTSPTDLYERIRGIVVNPQVDG